MAEPPVSKRSRAAPDASVVGGGDGGGGGGGPAATIVTAAPAGTSHALDGVAAALLAYVALATAGVLLPHDALCVYFGIVVSGAGMCLARQRTAEWFAARREHGGDGTGSTISKFFFNEIGGALGALRLARAAHFFRDALDSKHQVTNSAMAHGTRYEPLARHYIAQAIGDVHDGPFNYATLSHEGWRRPLNCGVSPDGALLQRVAGRTDGAAHMLDAPWYAVLELKCPETLGPYLEPKLLRYRAGKDSSGPHIEWPMKMSHFAQIQLSMALANAAVCIYAAYCTHQRTAIAMLVHFSPTFVAHMFKSVAFMRFCMEDDGEGLKRAEARAAVRREDARSAGFCGGSAAAASAPPPVGFSFAAGTGGPLGGGGGGGGAAAASGVNKPTAPYSDLVYACETPDWDTVMREARFTPLWRAGVCERVTASRARAAGMPNWLVRRVAATRDEPAESAAVAADTLAADCAAGLIKTPGPFADGEWTRGRENFFYLPPVEGAFPDPKTELDTLEQLTDTLNALEEDAGERSRASGDWISHRHRFPGVV